MTKDLDVTYQTFALMIGLTTKVYWLVSSEGGYEAYVYVDGAYFIKCRISAETDILDFEDKYKKAQNQVNEPSHAELKGYKAAHPLSQL